MSIYAIFFLKCQNPVLQKYHQNSQELCNVITAQKEGTNMYSSVNQLMKPHTKEHSKEKEGPQQQKVILAAAYKRRFVVHYSFQKPGVLTPEKECGVFISPQRHVGL